MYGLTQNSRPYTVYMTIFFFHLISILLTRTVYQPTQWTVPPGRLIYVDTPTLSHDNYSHMTILKQLIMANQKILTPKGTMVTN